MQAVKESELMSKETDKVVLKLSQVRQLDLKGKDVFRALKAS